MHENRHHSFKGKPKDDVAAEYIHNAEAPRHNTDIVVVQSLEQLYPDKDITIIPESSCNLLAFAAAGHAEAIPDKTTNATNSGALQWNMYYPPASRLDGGSGVIASRVLFGKYKYLYGDYEFILYLIEGRDSQSSYPIVRNNYIVSSTENSAKSLILAAGDYGAALHGEIWVFDQGFWQKDAALWASVQNASWDDVILDKDMKKNIIQDVNRYYDGRATYKRLKVPWKRGIIYHGPPGNGKTISIKATMNMLYKRKDPIPTLYVKTLSSFAGPEYSLNQIFGLARATAPCYLVFEDLDSIVSDSVRSFFLNQVDGLNNNDGILMVGSTNHLDRLDPGISKRPSRFDRKYLFPNPNFAERTLYAEFWRHKLLKGDEENDGDGLDFPEKLCKAIAGITGGFSFAYMQEAFVASLLAIANKEIDKPDCDEKSGQRDSDSKASLETEVSSRFRDAMGKFSPENLEELSSHFRQWKVDITDEDGGDDDKDLQKLVLWREMKSQVKILREEMGSPDDGDD